MSWISTAVAAVLALLAAAVAGSTLRAFSERRRRYGDAVHLWQSTPVEQRLEVFSALPLEREPSGPAWYLLGCARLHENQTRSAARAFGMAHHADWKLESAALLTFACLKAGEGSDSDLVEQIAVTWQEMKRPELLKRREDRLLLECLDVTVGPAPALSPLGRLAWLVVGPPLRPRVEQLFAERGRSD
jgi:hypothetical protein